MSNERDQKPRLVSETAERLRSMILEQPPDTQLGSLNQVADQLGVGIVTLQQAARILEHEGLLAVRRGPGGGYYGVRPDDAALERAFATYMRVHDFGYREAFEITLLLDCDIIEAAAEIRDEPFREATAALLEQLASCQTLDDQIAFEIKLRETLLDYIKRPLLELLSRVSWQLYMTPAGDVPHTDSIDLADWKQGRRRILHAIAQGDKQLAHFEAQRYRRMVLAWLHNQS